MPTPQELRERARQAEEKRKAEAAREAIKQASERTNQANKILAQVPNTIERLENILNNTQSGLQYRMRLEDNLFKYGAEHIVEAEKERYNQVMEHFRNQGYKAWIDSESTIEYGSDGGFPGPTRYWLVIDWSEEDAE